MGRHFLLYWTPPYANAGVRERYLLRRLGSWHMRRVAAGDTVWLVTARAGRLSLLGKLEVAEVLTPERSRRRVGEDYWPSAFQAFAKKGTAVRMRDVPLEFGEVAALRFLGTERDRLDVADGRVYPQQLQTMRNLTAASARVLARAWARTTETPPRTTRGGAPRSARRGRAPR